MANVWYYAEGDANQGPMNLAELTANLKRLKNPNEVLVWKAGWENWHPAKAVKELTAELYQPPPNRTRSDAWERQMPDRQSLASQPIEQTNPGAASKARSFDQVGDPELTGIAGWLMFLAIVQILVPIRTIATVGVYYQNLDPALIQKIPITILLRGVLDVGWIALTIYTSVLFFRQSERFPRFFLYQVVAAILSLLIGIAASADPREIGKDIASVITVMIWLLYLKKSKRVANTFVY